MFAGAKGRTPQGVRGLKYHITIRREHGGKSHPARGAWIEMPLRDSSACARVVAPRKGCVD